MGNIHKKSDELSGVPASPIVLFGLFLESVGVTPPTGWRWRKLGWIKTLNIAGRVYVSRDEINRFQQRAAAGEFSRTHITPSRKAASQ
jgi:hypothetical protein